MSAVSPDILDLAERKLGYLQRRQAVLARNVANADTPRWQTRDLKPFAETLGAQPESLARTASAHLAGLRQNASEQELRGERAPDGNAVSIDAQLVNVAENDQSQALTVDLYKKYLGMYRTALGR